MTTAAAPRNYGEILGDLYQRYCEDARKGRALVQTPEFVRSFILDRTLTPAIDTFGLRGTRLIDPSCGTGHFLVDAFWRLWKRWWEVDETERHELLAMAWGPEGPPERTAVAQLVLYQVYGVDLDPACVAIARYRLTCAATEASRGVGVAFRPNVFEGDALLHHRPRLGDEARFGPWPYDVDEVRRALAPGQYAAVVGNPPYITCKNEKLREAYRERYPTCRGQFSMAVPFTELMFGLALRGMEPKIVEHQGVLFAEARP